MTRPTEEDLGEALLSLGGYVRHVADGLRLKDWQFIVELGPDLIGSLATTQVMQRRRLAVLRFSDSFFDASDGDQRHAVCHELVHSHLQAIRDHADVAQHDMSKHTHAMFKASHDHCIETLADEWAGTVAESVPTWPEWQDTLLLTASRLAEHVRGDEPERTSSGGLPTPRRSDEIPVGQQGPRGRGSGRAGT
jgi:hypothetical protein